VDLRIALYLVHRMVGDVKFSLLIYFRSPGLVGVNLASFLSRSRIKPSLTSVHFLELMTNNLGVQPKRTKMAFTSWEIGDIVLVA
jgi:hypothetical protein